MSDDRPLALVVDDEPEIRELLTELLDDLGLRPLACADGEEALALVHAHRPALVVLDLIMPGVDGYTVLTRLRGEPATGGIPVIVVTGQALPIYRTLSLGVGATVHMTKPFSHAQFARTVARLVGRPGDADLAVATAGGGEEGVRPREERCR